MKISIQSFKGVSPRTNPRYLADGAAQVALNVEAFGQGLKPLKGLGETSPNPTTLTKLGTINTIYRFSTNADGSANTDESQYWFNWTAVVDVCRSQIAGDVSEWTFWTGDGYPKATYNALALTGSTDYPAGEIRLGLPAPTAKLYATVEQPLPETEPAVITLTESILKQVNSNYDLLVSRSLDKGVTFSKQSTVTIPTTVAPTVSLTASNLAAVTSAYGVYVSLDGGQTRTHCPVADPTSATTATVTLTSAHIAIITLYTTLYVSVDGGATYKYGTVYAGDGVIDAGLIALTIGQFAGSIVTAVVNGTSVVVTSLATGASAKLRVKFDSTTLSSNGTDGSGGDAATRVRNAINANASSLVTAAAGTNGAVVVTAKQAGATVKLRVWWGTATTQSVEAVGAALTPAVVAAAINAQAGADEVWNAVVKDKGVVVTTSAVGSNVLLKIQWGEGASNTLTASGTTQDLGTKETRIYTYTHLYKASGLTIESPPWSSTNMTTATVECYPGEGKEACLLPKYGGPEVFWQDGLTKSACQAQGGTWKKSYAIVHLSGFTKPDAAAGWVSTGFRFYRATAGSYLFVADASTTEMTNGLYSDRKRANELGEPCPSITWSPPPSTLKGLINLPNGLMAGFTGQDVRFCEPYRPYAWPDEYAQTVDFPVVGLGRIDTTLVVLTNGTPYLMQGVSPALMTVVKSDIEQACVAKRSIVSMGGAVLYASPDGLIMLSAAGSKNLTEAIFDRDDWQALSPTTLRAWSHDNKYIAFHNSATIGDITYNGFILDLKSGEFVQHNITWVTAGYNDLRSDQLFVYKQNQKRIMKWESGATLQGLWRSKVYSLPQITGFSCAQVEAETYDASLKCRIYRTDPGARAKQVTSLSGDKLTSRAPFRLEAKQGRDWEVELDVSQEVFNFCLAQSASELGSA